MNRLIAIIMLLFGASTALAQDQNSGVYNDNVVVVFDSSGSMGDQMGRGNNRQEKLALGKSALLQVLSTLPENTNVGIVTFKGVVYPLGPIDNGKLTRAVNGIRANGGTPLGEYMKTGADMLLKQRESQFGYGSYRLFVVTDGRASDERRMNSYAPEIVARGITLDTIGVDMTDSHSLAAVSSSYRAANDPDSLKQAVTEVFAEVGGTGAGSVSLDEAFGELQGFPEASATALVGAFRSSGNHPIGTKAPKPQNPVQQSSGTSSSSSSSSPNAPASGSPSGGLIIGGGVAVVIIVIIMIVVIGGGSRY